MEFKSSGIKAFACFVSIGTIALAFSPLPAHAAESGRRFRYSSRLDSSELQYTPSVAGSVASPSDDAVFGENPVGLIYNRQIRLRASFATVRGFGDSLGSGLSLYTGNGQGAASIGVQTVPNQQDKNGSITLFSFGVATYAETLDIAVGLDGIYRFTKKPDSSPGAGDVPTWSSDLGLLYNPHGQAHIGLTLYELAKGVTAAGVGLSTYLNPSSVVALDASVNNKGRGLTVKPGIAVLADSLSVTYAYGMKVDKGIASGITEGNTLGLGYAFNPQFKLQGYFNLVTPWYLGGTISF